MVTRSSLVQKSVGSPVMGAFTMIIVRSGLVRPGMAPVCGPSAFSGMLSTWRRPVRISAAALRTTSSVIRLRVPISSSSPQRPQLRTLAASSSTSAGRAIRP